MVNPDDLKRIITGGLDRLDKPKTALAWVKTEVRGLGLKPDTKDATANSVIRIINKVVRNG
jgi:hypothetical protein|tara:strand:- start:95 stop:277 length:183 start_codon:yes stop_codon:yes gene_type:complete